MSLSRNFYIFACYKSCRHVGPWHLTCELSNAEAGSKKSYIGPPPRFVNILMGNKNFINICLHVFFSQRIRQYIIKKWKLMS